MPIHRARGVELSAIHWVSVFGDGRVRADVAHDHGAVQTLRLTIRGPRAKFLRDAAWRSRDKVALSSRSTIDWCSS